MGSQGNYPGSGAINQHKYLAMRGEVQGGGRVMDEHLQEGGEQGAVNIANPLDNGFSPKADMNHRPGNVRAENQQ